MATETKLNKGNKMKTFKFFNTDHMNKFIAIYENSTFIYSHYDALKIIDDKTIQINDIDVWNALVHMFCTYDFNLSIFGDYVRCSYDNCDNSVQHSDGSNLYCSDCWENLEAIYPDNELI